MRVDITSIPVSEVFEPRDGCPVCRMRNTLDKRVVDYIMGAAMMESDVRQQTNALGFCYDHFEMMINKRNRLGLALILESHLAEVEKNVFPKKRIFKAGLRKSTGDNESTCFVCKQVDWAMQRMLSTVCRLWSKEREFRSLFDQQPVICLPHYFMLKNTAENEMSKKEAPDFIKAASALCKSYLTELQGDVTHFCRMFDYRSSKEDADWGNSKDSIERAVWFLTTRHPE